MLPVALKMQVTEYDPNTMPRSMQHLFSHVLVRSGQVHVYRGVLQGHTGGNTEERAVQFTQVVCNKLACLACLGKGTNQLTMVGYIDRTDAGGFNTHAWSAFAQLHRDAPSSLHRRPPAAHDTSRVYALNGRSSPWVVRQHPRISNATSTQ